MAVIPRELTKGMTDATSEARALALAGKGFTIDDVDHHGSGAVQFRRDQIPLDLRAVLHAAHDGKSHADGLWFREPGKREAPQVTV